MMRSRSRALVLAGGALVALAAGADDAGMLARVEANLAALHAVRASFRQELVDADGKVIDRAVGTLSLEKPGKFRWDYSQPKQLIVCDGTTLWLYDPELEQVTARRVKESLAQTPAMLLAGQGRISDGYAVSDAGKSDGLEWARLVPKSAASDFTEIRLAYAGAELRRMEFRSKLNQTTRIEFSAIERNPRLDPRLFHFVPPPGVDVMGPAGAP
jgi:outer membrane lipoprotein carrier protein